MFTKRILRILLIAAVTLLALNISSGAAEKLSFEPLMSPQADPTDMGTAFTYQGRLLSGSSPANGTYDFQFKLYDDLSAGTQIGSTITEDNYVVSDGLFMVDLDFGAGAYPGYERYLEIGVRPGANTGSYTLLSPRQKLNPTPYAQYARDAGDAAHADDADHADYADTIYNRTVVVKPVGTPSENGTALLAALDGITDASPDNRYLLKIEPGVYHIGGNSLQMKYHVDIEGSGELVTRIESSGFSETLHGTVITTDDAELRYLTVSCDAGGVDDIALALLNDYHPGTLSHVTLESYNGVSVTYGMFNNYLTTVQVDTVTIKAESTGSPAYGIYNDNSTAYIKDSVIEVAGIPSGTGILNRYNNFLSLLDSRVSVLTRNNDTQTVEGIDIFDDADTTIRNSQITVSGNSTGDVLGIHAVNAGLIQVFDSTLEVEKGNFNTIGINLDQNHELELVNVKVDAQGGLSNHYGIYEHMTPMTIHDSSISAKGGSYACGIYFWDPNEVVDQEVIQSVIKGLGAAPSGAPIPMANTNFGMWIMSNGTYDFQRETILTEIEIVGNGVVEGGIGLMIDGATVTLENSTINSKTDPAFNGIAHIFHDTPFNRLWVDNSEIYTCEEPTCATIQVIPAGAPVMPPASVSSTLLWGGPVMPGFPFLTCMWVTDENYTGYGWPAMPDSEGGIDPSSPICP
jgi:hypothetical protein